MVVSRAEERRPEEISLTGFTPQQSQLLMDLSRKFGLDQAATQRLGENLRDLTRATGTDFNLLLSAMRDIERTSSTGFLYSVPHTDARTVDLAMSILSQAYGTHLETPRARPVFSVENLGAATEFFLRGHLSSLPFQIGPKTSTWLERQAERNHMNYFNLSNAVMGYCALMAVNPELAAGFLSAASGGDARIESFARMFQQNAQATVLDDGRTSFWLRTSDAVEIAGDFRRDSILRSRISRTA